MFTTETYVRRRERLCSLMDNQFMLFLGNREAAFNYADNTYPFRQDSTFLYLFGIDQPNFAATIDAASGNVVIYADDVTMDDIIWMGPQPSVAEMAQRVGVQATKPYSMLAADVKAAARSGRDVHFVPSYRGETVIELAELLETQPSKIKAMPSASLIHALIELRSVKEQCEIEELERHMAVGYNMHYAAMRMAKDGVSEKVVRAALEYESLKGGGQVSFASICSVHGETLHNHSYNNVLRTGNLLLIDAGSESPLHYATDNTRTTPVGHQFTDMQKPIYQTVLDASEAVAKAIAPGVPYRDVHMLAARTIASGLKAVGLMKGDVDEAVAAGAHALFFPHGIGHMLGLDVHDMENYNDTLVGYDDEIKRSTQFGLAALRMGRRLQEGFVVTNEPGIYFIPDLIDKWRAEKMHTDFICYDKLEAYRNFGGIRLEDDYLVTASGGRVLGERLPITIADVEALGN